MKCSLFLVVVFVSSLERIVWILHEYLFDYATLVGEKAEGESVGVLVYVPA